MVDPDQSSLGQSLAETVSSNEHNEQLRAEILRFRAENARLREALALVDKWSLVITSCAFHSGGDDAQSVCDVILAVRTAMLAASPLAGDE